MIILAFNNIYDPYCLLELTLDIRNKGGICHAELVSASKEKILKQVRNDERVSKSGGDTEG